MSFKERLAAVALSLKSRRFAHDTQAKLSGATAAGILLAIAGAVLAVVGIFGLIFLPTATFPTTTAELVGVVGLVLAIIGGAVAGFSE